MIAQIWPWTCASACQILKAITSLIKQAQSLLALAAACLPQKLGQPHGRNYRN